MRTAGLCPRLVTHMPTLTAARGDGWRLRLARIHNMLRSLLADHLLHDFTLQQTVVYPFVYSIVLKVCLFKITVQYVEQCPFLHWSLQSAVLPQLTSYSTVSIIIGSTEMDHEAFVYGVMTRARCLACLYLISTPTVVKCSSKRSRWGQRVSVTRAPIFDHVVIETPGHIEGIIRVSRAPLGHMQTLRPPQHHSDPIL